ncbi:MAG: tRNA wybutosine-synthesizing protein 2 [Euryarchaeota archaeon]|nr:tRNA wybutosine-synthesizing protein 2 [Euryarchaeota archaeon]
MSRATPRKNRLAVIAKNKDADESLKWVVSLGIFDKSRKIIKRQSHVEIPVIRSVSGCELVMQEEPTFYRKKPDLFHALQGMIPEECNHLIPRGWFLLGEVVVVKIHPDLRAYEHHIGQALLDFYPRCCSVLADEGIFGPFREPVRRVIVGNKTQTVHKENKVIFNLDASLVMFSPGNLKERIRMSRFGKGEYVVDMFAGIGYFTLPMAVHSRPRKVVAIELNPNAYHYLCQNIRQNHVEEIVEPVLGDCAKVTPEGVADRVVMGMVQVTDQYLQKAISALRPGGILHYHQTIPARMYPAAAIRDVTQAAAALGRRAEIQSHVLVKKFSPGVVHAVIDARIDSDF